VKAFAALEVFLAEQPDADAGPDPTAAPFPLVGRGARGRPRSAAADFRLRGVPADAGRSGVDDVIGSQDGQRRLGDVRRQDDPLVPVRLKDLLLVAFRKAGRTAAGISVLKPAPNDFSFPRNTSATSRISRSVARNASTSPGLH